MLMKAGRNGTGRALPIPGSYMLAATVAVAAVALAAASLASGAYAAPEFAHIFDDEDMDGGAIVNPYDVELRLNLEGRQGHLRRGKEPEPGRHILGARRV